MVRYYRKINSLYAITLRSLAVAATMLPILLFLTPADIYLEIPNYSLEISVASLCLIFANWARGHAYRCMPVGIIVALCQSITSILLLVIGIFYLKEILTSSEIFWICAIIIGVMLLGFSKAHSQNSMIQARPVLGISLSLTHSILVAFSLTLITNSVRETDPILIGFLWELLAGFFGLSLCLMLYGPKILKAITGIDLVWVLVFCIPSAIGIAAYTTALKIGSVAVAGAIMSSMMAASALFAYLFYKEMVTRMQLIYILLIWFAVTALKLSAPYH